MNKKRVTISTIILFYVITFMATAPVASYASPPQWHNSHKVKEIFVNNNLTGTFVMYDATANTLTGYNQNRAKTRFIPASTFKIPHTIIGLATKTVQSVNEVLPYGGKPQPFAAWQHDMSLRQAIAVSNVPIYKELARRIGQVKMKAALLQLAYGNCTMGSAIDTFWLQGPLTISAVEQTQFLAKLAANKLPVAIAAQQATKNIIELERGNNWILYGKTGTATMYSPPLQWWVGWVITNNNIYSFALNIDVPTQPKHPATPDRITIGKACLQALGVL